MSFFFRKHIQYQYWLEKEVINSQRGVFTGSQDKRLTDSQRLALYNPQILIGLRNNLLEKKNLLFSYKFHLF